MAKKLNKLRLLLRNYYILRFCFALKIRPIVTVNMKQLILIVNFVLKIRPIVTMKMRPMFLFCVYITYLDIKKLVLCKTNHGFFN